MEYSEWVKILGKEPKCSNCIDGHRFTECRKSLLEYKNTGERLYNFWCPSCGSNWKYEDRHGIV